MSQLTLDDAASTSSLISFLFLFQINRGYHARQESRSRSPSIRERPLPLSIKAGSSSPSRSQLGHPSWNLRRVGWCLRMWKVDYNSGELNSNRTKGIEEGEGRELSIERVAESLFLPFSISSLFGSTMLSLDRSLSTVFLSPISTLTVS